MVAAPGLDERGPFLELGEAGCAVGLRGEEGGEGVGWWELKGCCGVRQRHLFFVSGGLMRGGTGDMVSMWLLWVCCSCVLLTYTRPMLILRMRGWLRYGGLLVE
jgi:hypothetical protein